MSFQICKFQLNDSKFLKYAPSQIAACTVIICYNIYKRDKEKKESKKNKELNQYFRESLKLQ